MTRAQLFLAAALCFCSGASMSEPLKPIQLNEVGSYGDLTSRPNPNGLVVLTVPDFDAMVPFIEQERGHKLSADEIKVEHQRAPSIVLTKEQAEKMAAARAKRK